MEINQWLKTELGRNIWTNKYQYDNETLDEWFERVSGGNQELKQLIIEKKFLFGGRTLTNRGTNKKGSYSNCYSHGYVEDDLVDIMNTNTDLALTFKSQGGQGLSLSKIRPKDTGVNGGQFTSDGIVPFMELYNRTTMSISQGGSRKGALMMSLDCNHKEIETFITIKSQTGSIEKANLSVEINDEFMNVIEQYYNTGEEIIIDYSQDYNGNKVEYSLKPIQVYKTMMQQAYDWAEPGVIFTNRFRNYNLMEYIDEYEIVTGNPLT